MYLTVAISGGAIFPVVAFPVARAYGTPYSLCVVVATSAFGALLPLYLLAVPQARKQVDPVVPPKQPTFADEGNRKVWGWLEKLRQQPVDETATRADHAASAERRTERERARATVPERGFVCE